nr:RNA-directed DNA polymerase, eukaryota [Tanacetum cinerariifolium]
MRSYRSKEDEVLKIFMSIFVANFLDSFGAKDLWNTCKQYGQVLDVDRLVNNLCTVWVGRHKLQANIPSNGVKGAANSYAHVVKGSQNSKMDSDSSPVMVLDDSCLNEKDYSLCLMGKVKDFATLANLKVVVPNEGFDNIKFKYMGGVTWVEIEGITLKMWSKNTFNRVASKWGVLLDVDDQGDENFHRKRICINTNVPTNIFESFKLIYRGKVFWVRAKEVPGWIPDFVEDNDEEENSKVGSYEEVPNGEDFKNVEDLEGDIEGEIVPDTKFKEDFPNQKGEEDSVGQGNVQSDDPFNIYELLNHKRPVIEKNSNSKESLKYPPGYTSTGTKEATERNNLTRKKIRRMMLRNPFVQKTNSTVSDYFVMVRGDWMPNGKQLLIISVYAPQELSEKKMLWDYLSLVMSNWEGEVVIMGDFNEVCNKSERFGKLFNRHGADVFNRFISNAGLEEVPLEGCSFTWYHRSATKMCEGENNVVNRRTEVVNLLQEVEKKNSLEAAQRRRLSGLLRVMKTPSSIMVGDKKAVWDYGIDKSFGPDGFMFGFYRRYWKLIENDVVDAKKKQSLVFKVDFEKAYDSVRWDHLDDIMRKFGFGEKWCMWIQSCLRSSRGSVIVNGSPMEEFQFYKGFKQGDPLSSFLFILVMKSLHISFQRVMDVGLFKGIELAPSLNLSHMFYADDAIFMGQWSESNIDTIVKVLDCFNRASGLRINMTKSKLLGISVEGDKSWNETIERIACRLSKWKLKTLSIEGRLTLLKSVLGTMPIYHMSLFKVPKKVLHHKDGLGVSSLFALNRALMFKWKVKSCYPSVWLDIIHEVEMFKSRGIDLGWCRTTAIRAYEGESGGVYSC